MTNNIFIIRLYITSEGEIMSQYVTLTLNENVVQEIIDDLELYCKDLDNYYEIEETVHLIDYLNKEIDSYHYEQNKIWKFINENKERYELKDDTIYDKLNDETLSNIEIMLRLNEKERERLFKKLK